MRALYRTYRLMQVFRLTHPDQVRALPVALAEWGLQFHATEKQVEAELESRKWGE